VNSGELKQALASTDGWADGKGGQRTAASGRSAGGTGWICSGEREREMLLHIISLHLPEVSLPGQNRVIRNKFKLLV
jgi:hypothetical protein